MVTEPESILKQLIEFRSDENSGNIVQFLNKLLLRAGFKTRKIKSHGGWNLIAWLEKGIGPSLLFNGHCDTVPTSVADWETSPFKAVIKSGRAYGLGAADMKGGLASMVCAALDIAKTQFKGTLKLAVICDEERGERKTGGTPSTIKRGFLADSVIICEPTNLNVCIGHKSVLRADLITKGKAAHGARLFLGENAITKMANAINAITKNYPVPPKNSLEKNLFGTTTVNIGTIQGGLAANIVPNECISKLDIRYGIGENRKQIIKNIKKITKPYSCIIKIWGDEKDEKGFLEPANSKLVKTAVNTIRRIRGVEPEIFKKLGAIDGRYYSRAGCSVINVGPANQLLCHKSNEYVEIKQVKQCIEIYKSIASQLLR